MTAREGIVLHAAHASSDTHLAAGRLASGFRADRRPAFQENPMLHYAVVFFLIALVAALFGFGGIAAGAAGIAKLLFIVFLVMAVAAFFVNLVRGRR
jgi:uncharacterized membrane protein YtjA (UPF0391 family)